MPKREVITAGQKNREGKRLTLVILGMILRTESLRQKHIFREESSWGRKPGP